MRGKLDKRIVTILGQGAVDLHGLTLSLWPCLEGGPRETALIAINYLRTRVAALSAQGIVISVDGILSLDPGRVEGRGDDARC